MRHKEDQSQKGKGGKEQDHQHGQSGSPRLHTLLVVFYFFRPVACSIAGWLDITHTFSMLKVEYGIHSTQPLVMSEVFLCA